MDILRGIAEIRNPVFDFLFLIITKMGEEVFFLAAAIFFFWCVNKREGYFVLITGLFGTVVNQAAKLAFRIPRPWVIDPEFEVVGNAKEAATGYSFPSGHTQNVAGTLGSVAAYKPTWKRVLICTVFILLVGRVSIAVTLSLMACTVSAMAFCFVAMTSRAVAILFSAATLPASSSIRWLLALAL